MQKLYQKTYKEVLVLKKIGLFFAFSFGITILLSSIYFSGQIDTWGYEKDLAQKIPFTKEETIICGRYDKNIVSFETNYGTKLNYTFPENTRLEDIAKFTRENIGQDVDIRIENIQATFKKVFNMKVQR